MENASRRLIHRRIRYECFHGRRIRIEVYLEIGKISWGPVLSDKQLVQSRNVDWSFVDDIQHRNVVLLDFWSAAQDFQASLLVKQDETGGRYQTP